MIHVLTIHWQSSDWIDIQLDYLSRYIKQPYRVYAFLNHVPHVAQHKDKFFYTSTEDIKSHPVKLNLLADMAGFAAESPDDLLVFLDGDAFPVAPMDDFVSRIMGTHEIAAIQRLENNGDQQPHPCFCMMSVATWKAIEGDWNHGGYTWTDKFGNKVWDVGGLMLKKLIELDKDWYKLHRSIHHDLHPLLFGVYDDLIYHHGAAFRNPGTRVDKNNVKNFKQRLNRFRKAKKFLPLWLARKLFLPLKYEVLNNQKNSDLVFDLIKNDPDFIHQLDKLS